MRTICTHIHAHVGFVCKTKSRTHSHTHTQTRLTLMYVHKFSMSRYFVVSLRVIAVVVFEFY